MVNVPRNKLAFPQSMSTMLRYTDKINMGLIGATTNAKDDWGVGGSATRGRRQAVAGAGRANTIDAPTFDSMSKRDCSGVCHHRRSANSSCSTEGGGFARLQSIAQL